MQFRQFTVAAGIIAIALASGCGKKDKDAADGKEGSKSSTKAGATDPVVGTWTIEVEKFKRSMFDAAVASGQMPAGVKWEDPMVQQMMGAMKPEMDVVVKADNTWTSTGKMGEGEAAEVSSGTWKKDGGAYTFTRTAGGDPEDQADPNAKVSVTGDSMTLTISMGEQGDIKIPLKRK